MSIVKELNELAERMTGENPKKKTIGKALDYIEQNYSTGGGGSEETTDVYYINYTVTENSETGGFNGSCDKTYSQLVAEINAFQQEYPMGRIKAKITNPFGVTFIASNDSVIVSNFPISSDEYIISEDIGFRAIMSNSKITLGVKGTYIKHNSDNTIEAILWGIDNLGA